MARRIRCTSLKEMAGLCNGRCRDEAACVITRYFAKVQSMNSAKYYVGIGLRLLLWLQDVCGNRAGQRALFRQGGLRAAARGIRSTSLKDMVGLCDGIR